MLSMEAGLARFVGDVNLSNARDWLTQGETALNQGVTVFDLAGMGQLDSSALSLLLSLRRRAQQTGLAVEFRNIPPSLASLADLYGVTEQL